LVIQLRVDYSNNVSVVLRRAEGAFANLVREVATATAGHTNAHVVGHGISTSLGFLVTDLIQSPLTEWMLLEQIENTFPPERHLEALAKCALAKLWLAQVRQSFDQSQFIRIFEPVDRLFSSSDDDDDAESLSIPQPPDQSGNLMAGVCANALARYDAVAPRNSWPWVLLREATFVLANESRYTQAELEHLMKSDTLGPVGCLSTAVLVGRVNPRLARAFAELGLSRLTVADFQRDYRLLLQSDRILNQVLANIIGLLGEFREEPVTLLTAGLNPELAAFLRQLAGLIRERGDQPPIEAAWPAWEAHWQKTTRRYLEAGLNCFLPQVQFLTNAKALYERGQMLVSKDSLLRDFEEAAQCFRKAADQGHAGAQLELGLCYEYGKGVRQDLGEAMRWYQKATEQKEPHAACTIARLYWQGKGVEKNLEEAEKWIRRELAELGDCPDAEYCLGRLHEMNRNWTEALKSYRHAAEIGSTEAQRHLGDLLTDGFTVSPPDYLEACQWLMLAVEKNPDRMTEITLRQVKAKLSPEQLKEVQKRVWAIEKRLADREKKKAEKPKHSSAPSGEAGAVQAQPDY
jgi:TPR repeat protein